MIINLSRKIKHTFREVRFLTMPKGCNDFGQAQSTKHPAGWSSRSLHTAERKKLASSSVVYPLSLLSTLRVKKKITGGREGQARRY